MKEILLVNPPSDISHGTLPPLGILSVASYLEANGYENRVELIDGCVLAKKYGLKKSVDLITEKIMNEKPLVVGCPIFPAEEDIASRILTTGKKVGAYTITGGHKATLEHKNLADVFVEIKGNDSKKVPLFDAVVRGEGEITTKELIDSLLNNKELYDVKGVTFYNDGVVANSSRELTDLNALPSPMIHLLPHLSEYDYVGPVEESRGCIFKCSFCSISSIYNHARLKSIERIKSDTENIYNSGAQDPFIYGELVLLEKERALKIADVMESFDYDKWMITAHPSLVVKQKDILPQLAEKGLEIIIMGIESANQNSLDVFNKGTTPEINEQAIAACRDAHIWPTMFFIPFQPYMSLEDVRENIVFMRKYLINFYVVTKRDFYPDILFGGWDPMPGTALYNKAFEDNLVSQNNKMKFKDKKVKSLMNLIKYFSEKYGDAYDKILNDVNFKPKYVNDYYTPEFNKNVWPIVNIPIKLLAFAYALVKTDMAQEKMVDWFFQRELKKVKTKNAPLKWLRKLKFSVSNMVLDLSKEDLEKLNYTLEEVWS